MIALKIHSCFGPHYFMPSSYDQGPIYSIIFAAIFVFVYIAISRKKKYKTNELPQLNKDYQIQQFDIIGQPKEQIPGLLDTEETFLFTPVDQKELKMYKLFAIIAAVIGMLYLIK